MLAVGSLWLDTKWATVLALGAGCAMAGVVAATINTVRRWAGIVEEIREKAFLLTDATRDGVWLFNPRTGETFFSNHLKAQLGISGRAEMDAILGMFGHVDPVDSGRAWEQWSALLSDRTPFSFDVRLIVQDTARWYRWSGRASAGPEPIFFGSLRYIHDLREVEERVNDIALFAVESPNPIFRLDPEGVILSANKATAPLLERWKTHLGQPLPHSILQLLLPLFQSHQQAELEISCADQLYSALFVPHIGRGYINVYCTDITERARLYLADEENRARLHEAHERMRFMAQHDTLTKLPNRALFEDRLSIALEHAKRKNSTIALMMVDLDRFKEINDTFGHDAGDAVLQGVAQRLTASVRGSDTVARLGGDEFAIVLGDLHEEINAFLIAEKILVSMADPIVHLGISLSTSPSIGIAFCVGGLDCLSLDEFTKRADVAMYHAKKAGRNRFCVFDGALDQVQATS